MQSASHALQTAVTFLAPRGCCTNTCLVLRGQLVIDSCGTQQENRTQGTRGVNLADVKCAGQVLQAGPLFPGTTRDEYRSQRAFFSALLTYRP